MSSCEKCWTDSIAMGIGYLELLRQRVGNKCTPEEQAGPDAGTCAMCQRKTIHQHTREPMCGCKPSATNGDGNGS